MEELKKDNKNEFDHAFAPVIFEIVKAIKNSENNSKIRKELKATLKEALQKYTNFETQMVSEKAYNYILKFNCENNTTFNPFNLNFDQHRSIFGKIDKKNMIIWEHVIPISNTINEFENDPKYNRLEEILDYLKKYSGTCLILREEDDKLNINNKSKRLQGWEKVYNELEIKINYRIDS